jgi:TRAP-type C4-dicarboxylate transport system substrate-binding protein
MKRLAFALAGATLAAGTFAQTQWDLPTGYAPASFQTENVQQFAADVAKASGGKLKIVLHPNGSLYKANEIKRAVQSGQAQAGEFILSGAANENPLFGVDSIPFLADSYAGGEEALRRFAPSDREAAGRAGHEAAVRRALARPEPVQQSSPSNRPPDLKGTKMRAYNPATSRIAQLLGAQPTTIQLAELGQALATGTVDNFLTSSASGVENKLYESVKYFYPGQRLAAEERRGGAAKAFDALDKPTQEALLKAAAAAEARGWKPPASRRTPST